VNFLPSLHIVTNEVFEAKEMHFWVNHKDIKLCIAIPMTAEVWTPVSSKPNQLLSQWNHARKSENTL